MANKLTEFVKKHDVSGEDSPLQWLALVHKSDLESLIRGFYDEIMYRERGYDTLQPKDEMAVPSHSIRSVFSEYINLDNNG